MKEEELVSYYRNKLPDHEEASWQACGEMQGDADAVVVFSVMEPLSGCCTACVATGCISRDVEVREAGKLFFISIVNHSPRLKMIKEATGGLRMLGVTRMLVRGFLRSLTVIRHPSHCT